MLRESCCLALLLVTSALASSPHIVFIVADDMVSSLSQVPAHCVKSETLTSFMSPSWQSYRCSSNIQIPRVLLDSEVHCQVHKSSPLRHTQSQNNQVQVFVIYFLRLFGICFDIILQSAYWSLILFLPKKLPIKILYAFLLLRERQRTTILTEEHRYFKLKLKDKLYKFSNVFSVISYTSEYSFDIYLFIAYKMCCGKQVKYITLNMVLCVPRLRAI
jgi:hypothetical protein